MSNRLTYIDQGIAFEVRIATKKNWWPLFFLPVWLVGWTLGGVAAFRAVSGETPIGARMFLIAWLTMWTFGEVFVFYTWVWNAFGKEIVRVESDLLRIKRDVFGLGPIRNFQTMEISNLRAAGFFGSLDSWSAGMAFWGLSGGTVAFDYKNKTHRFGIQLEEKEAREIVKRLGAYLPETAFSPAQTAF